eukprot:TRINITY_DN23167_c0_g1_i1.p2 TRINITY_DN23167_c0_g1~~TRINITY_DN23167_c0_g1_i1.p2  ORF type:complete len:237 (-),score=27.69 TRINITY_DN23167_c0_g1_i1:597-1307(-)
MTIVTDSCIRCLTAADEPASFAESESVGVEPRLTADRDNSPSGRETCLRIKRVECVDSQQGLQSEPSQLRQSNSAGFAHSAHSITIPAEELRGCDGAKSIGSTGWSTTLPAAVSLLAELDSATGACSEAADEAAGSNDARDGDVGGRTTRELPASSAPRGASSRDEGSARGGANNACDDCAARSEVSSKADAVSSVSDANSRRRPSVGGSPVGCDESSSDASSSAEAVSDSESSSG